MGSKSNTNKKYTKGKQINTRNFNVLIYYLLYLLHGYLLLNLMEYTADIVGNIIYH